ncbi:hypothetical protein KI387_005290, partial [Taxus chinensis]
MNDTLNGCISLFSMDSISLASILGCGVGVDRFEELPGGRLGVSVALEAARGSSLVGWSCGSLEVSVGLRAVFVE